MFDIATIKDIAKLAGVSPALVSRAFNGGSVSEKSKKKILDSAKQLNYIPRHSARSLRSGKVFSVGLYIINPSPAKMNIEESEFLYPLVISISNALLQKGYSLQFEQIILDGTEEKQITNKMYTQSVDGMIIFNPWIDTSLSFIPILTERKFPFVMLNPISPPNNVHAVYIDHLKGGEQALRYLSSKGHKEIGCIIGYKSNSDSADRFSSFANCAKELAIPLQDRWIRHGDFSIESGYKCMNEILSEEELPSAIFCVNDFMAIGAIRSITEHGLRIPQDISVLGFDDNIVARASTPNLTTFQQPLLAQGKRSVDLLIQQIEEKEFNGNEIALSPILVERDSVRDLNNPRSMP